MPLFPTPAGPIQHVRLRPFPYPYEAGLAICSDIDNCSKDLFCNLHRIINDPVAGLGLPVADSVFGWSSSYNQLCITCGPELSPSPHLPFILDCLRAGLVDTLHSFGDFNSRDATDGCVPRIAQLIADTCTRHGLALPVWTNHGSPRNLQNLCSRIYPHYGGDLPTSRAYGADCLPAIGTRYFAPEELVDFPLSMHTPPNRVTKILRKCQLQAKNRYYEITRKPYMRRDLRRMSELLFPQVLRDNRRLWTFSRFSRHPQGMWTRPTRHTLRFQLTSVFLQSLVASNGSAILYTHLGLPFPAKNPLFEKEDCLALERLAEQYHRGRIWVVPTSRLLLYHALKNHVEWHTEEYEGKTNINIIRVHDPVAGTYVPDQETCGGLTFYTPNPHKTRILLGPAVLDFTVNPPDRSGIPSVSLPVPAPPATEVLSRGHSKKAD